MMELSEFNKARCDYRAKHNRNPMSAVITYEQGFNLLQTMVDDRLLDSLSCIDLRHDIEKLLMEGDREKIKEHLNKMTMYGMQLIVGDIIIPTGDSK